MTHIPFRFADRNFRACQSCNDSDAGRVEACILVNCFFQSVAVEKLEPLSAGPLPASILGRRPGRSASLSTESCEQRDKLGVQRGDEFGIAFGFKSNGHGIEIDVALWVESGFFKPATLIPSDFKTVGQHLAHDGICDERYFAADEITVGLGKLWFEFASLLDDAELNAGVASAELALHCLLHDDAEYFEFEQSGVVAGLVLALTFIRLLAPLGIIEAMFAREVERPENFLLINKESNGSPCAGVALERRRFELVTDFEKPIDPIPSAIAFVVSIFQFLERFLSLHLTRHADVRSAIDATFCGDVFRFSVRSEFEPEVRASFLLIEARHAMYNLVSPWVQNPAKTSKDSQRLSKARKAKFEPGVRIPLSPPLVLPRFSSSVSPEYNSDGPFLTESAVVLLALFFVFSRPERSFRQRGPGVAG